MSSVTLYLLLKNNGCPRPLIRDLNLGNYSQNELRKLQSVQTLIFSHEFLILPDQSWDKETYISYLENRNELLKIDLIN